ncbi:uncharacterized protein [Haliotis cracherodii]|uniref:uncharacterized protein n=1 Tax=Haliotis cracherodii TaxID=6455 RepID=UPI0039E9A6AE
MKNSCYCCCQTSSNMMDIDSALNELGMLSSVTESRRQFLRERSRTKSEGSVHVSRSSPNLANGFQILQIDTNYVTGFSAVSPVASSPASGSLIQRQENQERIRFNSGYRDVEDSLEVEARNNRLSRIKLARARRFRKPYNVPGRLYHSMQESDFSLEEGSESRHSKSNATSPTKPNAGTCLTRSRSLDNLESARLKLAELFESEPSPEEKQALEQVSREMENLQVNE